MLLLRESPRAESASGRSHDCGAQGFLKALLGEVGLLPLFIGTGRFLFPAPSSSPGAGPARSQATRVGGHVCCSLSLSPPSTTSPFPLTPVCHQGSERERGPECPGQSKKLLPVLRGEMRPWSSPAQLGAGAHPTRRGDLLDPRPIPPPRLHRASSRRDPPYPRPAEPALEAVGSECQPGTPAASLRPADSPSQHRAMAPGPASRANVSGFCFLMEPGSGTEGHENGLQ